MEEVTYELALLIVSSINFKETLLQAQVFQKVMDCLGKLIHSVFL